MKKLNSMKIIFSSSSSALNESVCVCVFQKKTGHVRVVESMCVCVGNVYIYIGYICISGYLYETEILRFDGQQ